MNENEKSVVLVTFDDLNRILEIQRNCYRDNFIEKRKTFEEMINAYCDGCIGIRVDGFLAGYLFFHLYKDNKKPKPLNYSLEITGEENCMYLHDMAIHSEYRGMGLTSLLMEVFNERTIENNFKLQCLVAVQSSESFWEKRI